MVQNVFLKTNPEICDFSSKYLFFLSRVLQDLNFIVVSLASVLHFSS